jgi:hypothetical protein
MVELLHCSVDIRLDSSPGVTPHTMRIAGSIDHTHFTNHALHVRRLVSAWLRNTATRLSYNFESWL